MRIDIISDVICPWCFIGQRRLAEALALRPALPVTLRWRPFFLNPAMPAEGMDRALYLARKFGGAEQARGIYARIEAAGREAGIDFQFDRIRRTPNTLQAHRLLHKAGQHGVQDAVAAALFRAYFLDGADVGAESVLLAIATAAGLDAADVSAYLQSDADRSAIDTAYREALALGVNSVPCFVFADRYAVSGAQPAATLLRVLDELSTQDAGGN